MAELTKEERETLIRTDEMMNKWVIDTTQRTMCTKVRRIKGVVIINEERTENGTVISGRYELPLKCVSFRGLAEKRVLSDAEREILSKRAKITFGKVE